MSAAHHVPGVALGLLLGIFASGCSRPSASASVHGSTSINRAAAVSGATGESASYAYDAASNVVEVQSAKAEQLVVTGLTPSIGGFGEVVTVTGAGFSPFPSSNVLRLGQVQVGVQSATPTSLTFTVPHEARTGRLSVTCGASTATSSDAFTVVEDVVITDVTPTIGKPGTSVTITGHNFDPAASNDAVRIGTGTAAVSSATITSLQTSVPSTATSGKVSVTVGGSTAISSAAFFVVPSTLNLDAVRFTGRALPGTDARVALAGGQVALLLYDGIAGESLSLYVHDNTFAGPATVTLMTPAGVELRKFDVSPGSDAKLGPPALPATGTYTIAIQPTAGSAGSLRLQVLRDLDLSLPVDGEPVTLALATGQNGRCTFTGAAGDALALGYPSLVTAPAGNHVSVTLSTPDGAIWASALPAGPGSWQLPKLTSAGTYTLRFEPSGAASASVALLLSRPVVRQLAADGTPMQVSLTRPGQRILHSYMATAGQAFTVQLTTPKGVAGMLAVRAPSGASLLSSNFAANADQKFDIGVAKETGLYEVGLTPSDAGTGTVILTVIPQATDSLVVGAAPKVVALSVGQNGRITFSGTAGDVLSLGYPTFSTTRTGQYAYLEVDKPNGDMLRSANTYSAGSLQLPVLPATGTYTLRVASDTTAALSMSILLSTPITGVLSSDGAVTRFETARAGQRGDYTFSVASSQSDTLHVTTASTFPSGVALNVTTPDGRTLLSRTLYGSANSKFDLGALTASGDYTVRLTPMGDNVGWVDLRVVPQASDVLTIGDPPKALTLGTGQNGRFTFLGAAGDQLALTVSAFSAASPSGYAFWALYTPDGANLAAGNIYQPSTWTIPSLPASGTYVLAVMPDETGGASFSVQLVRRQ